ncbi:restriction endonuclease subunit S [Mycoplasmopsis felis]|uniref:restriction endonuclease subunit S n=1 Tax=Mycoplasmopsis felis TaxID=33923 RepID=UPI003A4DD316
MKKVLVPSVRFKGFDEEWKEEKISNILTYVQPWKYLTKKKNYDMLGNIPVLTANKSLLLGYSTEKNYFNNDCIIFDDFTQDFKFINYPFLLKSSAIKILIPNNNYSISFIFFLFNSLRFETQGHARHYISYVQKKPVRVPILSEANRISKLLDEISNLITLEQSKLNKLKQLRETLLQKMFPEGNSKVPRIRFKGFDEEWKEDRLEEIGQTYTGLSGKTKKDFGHGNSRYITYLNIFNNPIANLKGLDRIEEDYKQNSVKYGDIFVTTSSEIPEEVGMTSIWPFKDKENIYLNSFCFGIRLNNINNYYTNFLAYNLRNNELRKDIVLLAQGISRFNISNRRFMKLNILLPNISEQQKIGDFFSKIDTLINLYNSKLNKLKQIKEALLQKMFV